MYWHAMAIVKNNFPQLVRMWLEELCYIDVLKRCCGSSGPISYCCSVDVMGYFREFVLHWKGVGWRAINAQSTSILDKKYVAAQWVRFRGYWVDTSRVTLRLFVRGSFPLVMISRLVLWSTVMLLHSVWKERWNSHLLVLLSAPCIQAPVCFSGVWADMLFWTIQEQLALYWLMYEVSLFDIVTNWAMPVFGSTPLIRSVGNSRQCYNALTL